MVGERGFEPPTPWSRTRFFEIGPILRNQRLARRLNSISLLNPVVSATSRRLCQLQNRHQRCLSAKHRHVNTDPSYLACASVCLLRLIPTSPFLRPNRIPNWTEFGGHVISMKFRRIVRMASTSARIARSAASVRSIPAAHRAPTPTESHRRARPATPAPAAPPPRLWSPRICCAARAASSHTPTRAKAARQACGPCCVQRQAAKGKISASWIDGESAHRVHLMLRAASQGHVLTVRRFFFRRSLFDLSYRIATAGYSAAPSWG